MHLTSKIEIFDLAEVPCQVIPHGDVVVESASPVYTNSSNLTGAEGVLSLIFPP